MHLLRKLSFAVGLTTFMVAHPVFALGLGESELNSALNQPLEADIRLTNLRGLSSNEIIVRLASDEDFRRAGLDRQAFYSQLDFELMLDHPEGPIVRVTTDDPVREPYLNFLVEARWATGRLLREYTFLLDLPTFDEERQAQPVEAATTTPQRSTSRPASQPAREARPTRTEQAPAPSSAPAYTGETYEVGSNDTLWEIALRVRPGRDVSVQQTMLAIHRENPEAFINGNINLLREGQVLRLPDRSDIQGLSQQRAVREVAEHNRKWSGEAMGAQLDAGSRESGRRPGPSDVSGQVRLAAPNQGGGVETGQGGGDSTESGAALESELAAAREELDKSRRENRELAARVEELEAQIETMESLVDASNEQLAALQAAAADQRAQSRGDDARMAATPDTEAEESDVQAPSSEGEPAEQPSESGAEPAQAADTGGAAAEAADDAESTDAQAAAEEAEQRDRNTRVVRSLPEKKSLIDHLMDNIVYVGGGLLALLLGALLVVRRRAGKAAEGKETDYEEDFDPAFEEESFSADDDELAIGDEDQGMDLASDQEEYDESDQWEEDAEAGVEAETGDVVGEADIYIAYGKLDQAEELLLKGLRAEPNSPAVLSKLLEVYAEKRDIEAFDRHYATLLGTDDRASIQRAGELRDTIEGAGEFDLTALDGAADSSSELETESTEQPASDDDEALDFSFELDEADTTESEVSAEAGKTESEDDELTLDEDFSFDLDDDLDFDTQPNTEEAVTTEGDIESPSSRYDLSFDSPEEGGSEEDFSLDFDLEEDGGDSVSLEDAAKQGEEVGDEESFPELDLNLEDEALTSSSDDTVSAEDDWDFDLDTEEGAAPDLESLDDDLSVLDEEPGEKTPGDDETLTLEPQADTDQTDNGSAAASDDWEDDLSVQDFGLDDEATSEDEQEAGQDAFADLDDALLEEAPEPEAENRKASDDSEGSDLDFDELEMGDMDLSSLDEEMSGLDADLEEPAAAEPSTEKAAPTDEDQVFEEALSGLSTEDDSVAGGEEATASDASEEDMDAELDFLADTDEAATKLDLARAYIDMGDTDGARDILEEVRQEGNDEQQQEASELLGRIDA